MENEKTLLERLKLIDHLTSQISIDKKDFVEKLKRNVDEGDTGFFLSAFEAFSSSKNEYKGKVAFDSFKIRRRRKLFDVNTGMAVAEGNFRQKENLLIIESTINGFTGMFIPILIILLLFYTLFIGFFIFSDTPQNVGWFLIPFILVHATMMLGIPYLMVRRGVSRMKYELERDFYYMTK